MFYIHIMGLTENVTDMKMMGQFARNLQGMKLQDMKMTDQFCRP